MDDLLLREPVGQDCLGQFGGHIPVHPSGRVALPFVKEPVSGFPDILLFAQAAPVGRPCLGRIAQLYDENGKRITDVHALAIAVHPEPVIRSAPTAALGAFRDITGQVHDGFMYIPDGDQLPISMTERMLDAWRTLLATGRVVLRGGRAKDSTNFTPDVIHKAVKDARRLKGEALSWDQIAARIGVSKSTIRRWIDRTEENPNFPSK